MTPNQKWRSELRYRQIHLDFHTSEHIPGVGEKFDKKQFVAALKRGNVDSVTVFAKCHHGWSYYPTKVGVAHPNLKKQLLPEMIEACRENDINVPVYFTVQWDEWAARTHPEWRVVKAESRPFQSSETETSDLHQMRPTWHSICVSHDDYIDYLIAHTLEVIELYKPDGIFQDILLPWECVCQKCLDRMKRDGLDANKKEDRLKNHRNAIIDYYKKMSEAVWKKDPEMRLFHNSGHIYKNERERWKYFSHLELESLPTGGWGYDHFPISARYANTLGIDYLGMTGKFHTTWGEFGGFKKSAALEYECLLMVAMGARCSVGDQLHPSGEMEMATYESIGPGYGRVKEIEAFLRGARPVSEIAILSAEGRHRSRSKEPSDIGSARMLLEEQLMFDVIDEESDFEKYKCLVFPDVITLEGKLLEKTKAFLKQGGKLILSGSSGLSPDEKGFAIDFKAEVKGMSEFQPDYLVGNKKLDAELPEAPFVMYEKAHRVKSKGAEVLAETKVPYFNRTWEHFSSHQHAPFRPEKNADYDGILRDGNVIYFSHPIFRHYYTHGTPFLKYIFRGALKLLFPEREVAVKMPSNGRVSFMAQPEKKRKLLHLLFAQTQLRGEGATVWGGQKKMEIIEDIVPIHGVEGSVRMAKKPSKVYLGASGKELPTRYENGRLSFTLDKLYIHELIVIEE